MYSASGQPEAKMEGRQACPSTVCASTQKFPISQGDLGAWEIESPNLPQQVRRDLRLCLTFFLDEIDRSGWVIFARCGAVGEWLRWQAQGAVLADASLRGCRAGSAFAGPALLGAFVRTDQGWAVPKH